MKKMIPLYQIGFVLLFGALLPAQNAATAQSSTSVNRALPQQPSAQPDELSQMRDNLNTMESLNLNMSSEIEFLRDQNLQILLRTNSQMWTILIRDLRRQVAAEEQRRTAAPPAGVKK